MDTERVLLLDPQTLKPLAQHILPAPYYAMPPAGAANMDPSMGTVPVQFLGDPHRAGLLLPYGVGVESAVPTWRFTNGPAPKGSVGPWFIDDRQQPEGRKYKRP